MADERIRKNAEPGNPRDAQDPRMVEQFVRDHELDIYTYALRMVGNKEDAADLAQEAMLKTFRTWSQVDPNSNGGYVRWCYRILRNLCIDFKRKKRPRTAEDDELERKIDSKGLRPEDIYENRVQHNEIREALLGLPDKYREVLLLRYQTDMSYEQIAQTLEVPVTTVETRIHRAKKMLRVRLESSQ